MSLRERAARDVGRGFGVFAVAFAVLAFVIAMLSQVGLPGSVASVLLATGTLLSFVVIGFATRTMNLQDFQVALRGVPPALNGMATAAAFLASAGFLGLAGAFFAGSGTVFAVVAGWTIGFLVLSVLIAPYLRKSAAVTVADFLAIRFGSALVRLAAVVVTVACTGAFLVAEVAIAGQIAASFLDISAEAALGVAMFVILAGTLLGGMRAVTMTAVAQYIVLTIGILTPVTILSLQHFSFPLPQLSYGFALMEASGSNAAVAGLEPNRYLPLPSLDGFNMAVLAVCLAVGVASMPHIAMRSTTSTGVGAARRSAGWALFFVLIVVATAPTYAAFAQLTLLGDAPPGPLDASTLVLNLPAIADLSPAVSALAATGALAAILASATALLFAIASTIGHDFYSGLIDRRGPPARRLIVTRIILIATTCLVGWYATRAEGDLFALAATSASLAASGLFPALLLGIWWKRATALGALAGMLSGFVAAAAYVVMVLYEGMAPWQPLGDSGIGLPPMAAAFIGVPIGLLVTIFVSQITPTPKAERIEIIDEIRRPSPSRLFYE